MEERYTIFFCDECGRRFTDEREIIACRVRKGADVEHHVCYDCIGDFAERMKSEVEDAG